MTATSSAATTPAPLSTPAATALAAAKLAILSHRTKGSTVTVVLQAPAPGVLTLTGSGLRSVRRAIARAGRVSVTLRATPAGLASLRRHRALRTRLRASFAPSSGAPSAATTTVKLVSR